VLLATICSAFNPLFFGASIFLNTDFPASVFFTLATVFILYGHYGFFRKWGIYPIAFSFLIFIGFNISYITFIIPRYVITAGFFLILLLFFTMLFCIRSARKRQYVFTVLTLLCFAQTFRTIDPVSKIAYGSAPFSDHKILQIDSAGEAGGNGFVYNAEFTKVDKLLNLMHQSMPMTADTTLIAWNRDAWYPWFDFGTAWVDAKTLKRTIDWRNGFKYRVINIDDVPSANKPAEAFYIYMPWLSKFSNEQDELNLAANYYHIGEMTEINHRGYKLRYYKLTIK
jgi:hypothetical protein